MYEKHSMPAFIFNIEEWWLVITISREFKNSEAIKPSKVFFISGFLHPPFKKILKLETSNRIMRFNPQSIFVCFFVGCVQCWAGVKAMILFSLSWCLNEMLYFLNRFFPMRLLTWHPSVDWYLIFPSKLLSYSSFELKQLFQFNIKKNISYKRKKMKWKFYPNLKFSFLFTSRSVGF